MQQRSVGIILATKQSAHLLACHLQHRDFGHLEGLCLNFRSGESCKSLKLKGLLMKGVERAGSKTRFSAHFFTHYNITFFYSITIQVIRQHYLSSPFWYENITFLFVRFVTSFEFFSLSRASDCVGYSLGRKVFLFLS